MFLLLLLLEIIRRTTYRACSHGQGAGTPKGQDVGTTPSPEVCSPEGATQLQKSNKENTCFGGAYEGVGPSSFTSTYRERITEGCRLGVRPQLVHTHATASAMNKFVNLFSTFRPELLRPICQCTCEGNCRPERRSSRPHAHNPNGNSIAAPVPHIYRQETSCPMLDP